MTSTNDGQPEYDDGWSSPTPATSEVPVREPPEVRRPTAPDASQHLSNPAAQGMGDYLHPRPAAVKDNIVEKVGVLDTHSMASDKEYADITDPVSNEEYLILLDGGKHFEKIPDDLPHAPENNSSDPPSSETYTVSKSAVPIYDELSPRSPEVKQVRTLPSPYDRMNRGGVSSDQGAGDESYTTLECGKSHLGHTGSAGHAAGTHVTPWSQGKTFLWRSLGIAIIVIVLAVVAGVLGYVFGTLLKKNNESDTPSTAASTQNPGSHILSTTQNPGSHILSTTTPNERFPRGPITTGSCVGMTPPIPRNGATACLEFFDSPVCFTFCDAQWDIGSSFVTFNMLICSGGSWSSNEDEVLHCSVPAGSSQRQGPLFYYQNPCNSSEGIMEIQNNYVTVFRSTAYNAYCKFASCDANRVAVYC